MLDTQIKELSVTKTADLCGVNRNTVGYWIKTKKLRAHRVGKNYSIPVEDLLFYLKSSGQNIPDELSDGSNLDFHFKTIQRCWQYFQGEPHGNTCHNCIVFKNNLEICFPGKRMDSLECSNQCHECHYYLETYLPRIQFIHQISIPAAVYQDFYIWGGNSFWAALCGVQEKNLLGIGIEEIFHPDSLETLISNLKKRELEVSSVPRSYKIFLKNNEHRKLQVDFSVYPLKEPSNAFLVLAEQEEKG